MTAPFRPPMPAHSTEQQRWLEYERRKSEWTLAHPEAGPERYQAAIQRIARECGV